MPWNRFGPLFAAEIRKRRVSHGSYLLWRWHLDEVFVRINGETHYLWHTFASRGLIVGEGLPMIGKLLGHSQIQIT